MLLGSREDGLNFTMCINDDNKFGGDYKVQSNLNLPNETFDWTQKNNIKTKINNNKYELYINDVKEKEVAIQDFSYTANLYLFGFYMNGSVTTRGAKFRFYKCKIYDDDILIRDFIPVKRKVDNVIGMYDLVEGKFYGNNGTGTFPATKELLLLNELKWIERNQEVLHINSNLFDENNTTNNMAINSNGVEVTLSTFRISEFIKVKNLINYILSFLAKSGESQTVRVHFYDENKNWLSQVSILSSMQSERIYFKFETPQNCKFIRISIYKGFFDVMVSEGFEKIQYIEHKSKKYQLTNLPALYSENDCIYYDEKEKKNFVHNECDKYILTGNEAITVGVSPDENLTRIEIRNAMNNHELNNNLSAICNFATVSNDIKSGNIRFGVAENANTLVYYINKNIFPTTTVFKNFIKQKYESGNPLYVIYKTENPTEKEIPDPVLIEQLDKLRAISTYKGTNNFIITAENGQSANLKIEVYKDGIKILNDKINNLEQAILNS